MEKELEVLANRVNFFESCVNLLKRDVPKYMHKHAELSKTTKVLSNTIKDVAASETNLQLQEILFQLSNKYDILEHNLEKQYKEESEQNNVLLEQMKSAIIAPLREVLNDCNSTITSVKKMQKEKKYVIDKEKIASNEKLSQLAMGLPIHAILFEKYRIKNLHEILRNMVHQDVAYHIQAIENLSPILTLLQNLENNMKQEEARENISLGEVDTNSVNDNPLGI